MSNIRSVSATALRCSLERLAGLLDLCGIGIGKLSQPLDRRFRTADQRVGSVAEKRRRATASQQVVYLIKSGDAHQRVAADDVVVEKRQRQARHKGVYPQRQPRQLHGNIIDVHAVDAPPGNLPAEQLNVLDLDAVDRAARLLDAVERRLCGAAAIRPSRRAAVVWPGSC